MDVQLVNNAVSVSYYVCAYVCKNEPDELRTALGNLFNEMKEAHPQVSNYHTTMVL